nr:hypothetical protein CFP56_36492 [Quercus suber]
MSCWYASATSRGQRRCNSWHLSSPKKPDLQAEMYVPELSSGTTHSVDRSVLACSVSRLSFVHASFRSSLQLATTGVHCAAGAVAEENHSAIYRRDKPQKHVDQIHPYSVLHTDLSALSRSRIGRDVQIAKDAKERSPEDTERCMVSNLLWLDSIQHLQPYLQQNPIPPKGPIALDERYSVDQTSHRTQACNHLCINPFAVRVCTLLLCAMKIDPIQCCDDDCEDELKETHEGATEGANKAARVRVTANSIEDSHGALCLAKESRSLEGL